MPMVQATTSTVSKAVTGREARNGTVRIVIPTWPTSVETSQPSSLDGAASCSALSAAAYSTCRRHWLASAARTFAGSGRRVFGGMGGAYPGPETPEQSHMPRSGRPNVGAAHPFQ